MTTRDPARLAPGRDRRARSDGEDEAVLVSACLVGRACTYRATDNADDATDEVRHVVDTGRSVPVCPEVEGGLPTPRPPAEIQEGDGHDVLDGRARVVTADGTDVTDAYLRGAAAAVRRARETDARRAVLKARSPSCGRGAVYDGSFAGALVAGDGVTAAALQRAGVEVVTEDDAEAPGDG